MTGPSADRLSHLEDPSPLDPRPRLQRNIDGTWERWTSANGKAWRLLERDHDGTPLTDTYIYDGRASRLDGPARTVFHPDGSPREIEWCRDGVRHRIDGPAWVVLSPDGASDGTWWFAGRVIEDPRWVGKTLALYMRDLLVPELTHSSYGPLLDEGHSPRTIVDLMARGVASAEGMREVFSGAPVEWVAAYEKGARV